MFSMKINITNKLTTPTVGKLLYLSRLIHANHENVKTELKNFVASSNKMYL
jgi:hypothetical protein